MNVSKEYVAIDSPGRGYGYQDHMGYTGVGLAGLVILILFLIGVAWAVNNGNHHNRESIRDGHNWSGQRDTVAQLNAQAAAVAIQGINEKVNVILNKVDQTENALLRARGELQAGFVGINGNIRSSKDETLLFGVTEGFNPVPRILKTCRFSCDDDRRDDRNGGTTIDFNTGLQLGNAIGSARAVVPSAGSGTNTA